MLGLDQNRDVAGGVPKVLPGRICAIPLLFEAAVAPPRASQKQIDFYEMDSGSLQEDP